MVTVVLRLNERYADAITLSAIGLKKGKVSIFTGAFTLEDGTEITIDKNGKQTQRKIEVDND